MADPRKLRRDRSKAVSRRGGFVRYEDGSRQRLKRRDETLAWDTTQLRARRRGSRALTQGYVPGDMPFRPRFKRDVKLDGSQVRYADRPAPRHPAPGRTQALNKGVWVPSKAWIGQSTQRDRRANPESARNMDSEGSARFAGSRLARFKRPRRIALRLGEKR